MDRKPRIFIGSSVESIPIADAINENLDHSAEVTIWRNGTFELSSTTIESLIKKASSVDFAIFIFSPDDITIMRSNEKKTTRDNVIFELGLFIGKIGVNRCFIVKPRGNELHLPSDLLGLTTADFEANRSDGDLASALNHACSQIKKSVKKYGIISNSIISESKSNYNSKQEIKIKDTDFDILKYLLPTMTEHPDGYDGWTIKKQFKVAPVLIDLSISRLEKIGYIEKRNEVSRGPDDFYDRSYYLYKLSNDGLEYLLENEEKISKSFKTIIDWPDTPF